MKASENLFRKIEEFEGLRTCAYRCPAGVWTIGIGHTEGVCEGMELSEHDARLLLRKDVEPLEKHVSGYGLNINQQQFDSLVDFAFNLGTKALDNSTLLRMIRGKAPLHEIRKEFGRWVYANGKKLQGLVRRREWEASAWV